MAHKCDGCKYKGEHQEMMFRPFGVCMKETNLLKAQQNYDAECCPYIVDAYAEGTAEELQKVLDDLTDGFQASMGKIQCCAQTLIDVLTPTLNEAIKAFKTVWDAILHSYPNKRVISLAMHHPKERVRKKNIRRIMRWIEKGENNG